MKWYYLKGDQQIGPITETAIRDLKNARIISGQTPIRREGSDDWLTVGSVINEAENTESSSISPLPPSSGGSTTTPKLECEPETTLPENPEVLQSPKTSPERHSRKSLLRSMRIKIACGILVVIAVAVTISFLKIQNRIDGKLGARLVEQADRIVHNSPQVQDWQKVVSLLQEAAELKNHEAEYKLGSCHLYGRGTPVDAQKAVELFRRSAEGGYAEGQFNLSACYYHGNGVERSEEEMLKWLKLAADQKLPQALHSLGLQHLEGQAVPQDLQKGILMITDAADQGHSQAQYELSLCYEMGNGVPKNLIQAYKWAIIATHSGLPQGDEAVEELRKQLSLPQAQEGLRLAAEWKIIR